MKRILITGLLAAFLVLSTGALYAWEEGPYLGFGLGSVSYDLDVDDYDDGNLESGAVDTSDAGYKIFGGYRITPNLAVEIYYADLGEANFSGRAGSNEVEWCEGPISTRDRVDGLGLSVLGNAPIGRDFNLYGKFGIYSYTSRFDYGRANPIATNPNLQCRFFTDRRTDTELAYGLGASYQVNYRTAVHLEWERFPDIVDTFDIDFFSLNLSFDLY